MKKFFIYLMFVALIGLTACSSIATQANEGAREQVVVEPVYMYTLDSLNDVAKFSTNIVKATLVSFEDFDGMTNVYSFKVDEDYTKNTPSEIYMYDAPNEDYIPGHTYYLFLCSGESALFPHTIYTTVVKDLIIDETSMQTTTFIAGNALNTTQASTEEVIEDAVINGVVGQNVGESGEVSISSDIFDITEDADVIAEIRISSEMNVNKYASDYFVELVNILKGSGEAVSSVMTLPPNLDPNSNYYVFLKADPASESAYFLSSRVCPIIETTSVNSNEFSIK